MPRFARAAIVAVALALAACGGSKPSAPAPYDFGGNATMKAGVVVVPQAVAEQAVVTSSNVTFPRAGNEGLLAGLQPGAPLVAPRRKDVFSSNNALGMLRKVVSVSLTDTSIVVETVPGTLDDVFTGDFSVTTPDGELRPLNPAGLDVVAYFFGDDPGIDLSSCDATGVCTPKPDDGKTIAPMSLGATSKARKSPLFGRVPARYGAAPGGGPSLSPKSLTPGDLAAAGPAAVDAALSDVIAVRTRVRSVAEQGLASFSSDDTQKLFRIAARNFLAQGDTDHAAAATTIANYVANPAGFQSFQKALRQPVHGTLGTKNILTDALNAIGTLASDVVNSITSLLDVDVTLTVATIGVQKGNPITATFLAGNQVKQLGKAEYVVSTQGSVSAYAFVQPQAHFDGHIGIPSHATFWIGGQAGAGASIDAQLKASLQSMSPEPQLAERLVNDPTRSATPWSKKLATLGPYEGPTIGPVPTTFSVELSLNCSWSLYGQIDYQAAIDLTAAAKIGATISSDTGWTTIAQAAWDKSSSQALTLGGGAEVECGLETKVDWLVADAVGPFATLSPGVKAEASYSESCAEATGTSPDGEAELKVSATLESEVGATLDFAGFELGDLTAAKIIDEDWELWKKTYDWPGAGWGYCSVSCSDQRKNGDETDVDCGGSCAAAGKPCRKGQACNVDADCPKAGSCKGSTCVDPAYCSSGLRDGDETDVDCGGSCVGCALGKSCTTATDCQSMHCQDGACAAPTCSDGVRNGAETDVDCGSAECVAVKRFCAIGQHCTTDAQCTFGTTCVGGACAPPASCANGMLDPGEASWDCGGPCPACADGSRCTKGIDCQSGACDGSVCTAPACADGVKNGDETDLDCGGACATSGHTCKHGQACKVDGDCMAHDRCLGGGCAPAAHCSNGIADAGETDVDCGGADCFACGDNRGCASTADCASGTCIGGVCRSGSCFDHVKDQDETDVDCGGVCDKLYLFCRVGQGCVSNYDCGGASSYVSNEPYCNGSVCVGPLACQNGMQDASTYESDIDCGGSCQACGYTAKCTYDDDCQSGACRVGGPTCLTGCDTRRCQQPTCDDRTRNGDETDVDCGGSCAAAGRRCGLNQHCGTTSDCLAGWKCVTGLCLAPASCSDGAIGGAESDVDCGGGVCPGCAIGKACRGPQDCASGVCNDAGQCAPASCTDRIQDGDELDVDCGGSCGQCKHGQRCAGRTCGDGLTCSGYTSGACIDRTCFDGVHDGAETDVDCGGHCAACADGSACTAGGDCASGVCTSGKCAYASCSDGVMNGNESDVDCGGSCGACGAHKRCRGAGDCASASCFAGACQTSSCTDGIRNGGETDLDCGGVCDASGLRCADGRKCAIDDDCGSGFCRGGVCAETSCSDGYKHGTETDVDCGGVCAKCSIAMGCAVASDCTTGVCGASTHVCAAPSCVDGVKNGSETALDCGGGCPACADLSACVVNSDCRSRLCKAGTCAIATCNDGASDGKETGVDCGGGTCAPCAVGGGCGVGTDCQSGVCAMGACATPSCSDAVKNGTETDVDCGGSCAATGQKCAVGKACAVAGDCASGSCTGGVCVAASTCSDGVQDGTETDTDCGGGCSPCYYGAKCKIGADCQGSVCTGGFCATPTCTDGVKNGGESDVDCGGSCSPCPTGKRCLGDSYCVAGDTCVGGFCVAPAGCSDGIKNGTETDVDCGGGTCPACASGKTCAAAGDCQSSVCTSLVCAAASCSDGIKNGTETDVDCGGSCDAAGKSCALGKHCSVAADCASPNSCSLGVCIAPASCADGIQNQNETDVDCGGVCAACAPGKMCSVPTDCTSDVCTSGRCASPSCTDGVKNGTETDKDCGGTSCPKCADGLLCAGAADCVSSVCSGGRCAVPTCTDGAKNQDETAIDCGGTCDTQGLRCMTGLACAVNNDCQSLYCAAGTCASGSCNDGVKNGTETDVDCGGSCAACATGKTCSVANDCLSKTCTGGVCVAPACSPSCATGAACGAGTDCASGVCTAGSCAAPACGPNCSDGQACGSDADCASGLCKASKCVPLFGAASSLTTDSAVWLLGVGDINSDGKPDITAVTDNGNLDLLTGTGAGAFSAYVTGPGPASWSNLAFRLVDVNGDGKLDVMTGSMTVSELDVYLGHGDGTFGAVIASSGNGLGSAAGIALGDLDLDGKLDAVWRDGLQSRLGVLRGVGGGSFGAPTLYGIDDTSQAQAIAIANLDGDTWPDIVAGTYASKNISVLKGSGSGNFAAATLFPTGQTSHEQITLVDVTDDGKIDALTAANGTPGLAILKGNGDATFQAATSAYAGRCWSVAVADLNGDGHVDIVCGGDTAAVVLLGQGGGVFRAARLYTTGTYMQDVALSDLDGDGDLDVVLASSNLVVPGKTYLLFNQSK